MSEAMSVKETMELIKLKNEKPEEYKKFLKGFGEVMKDTFMIMKKIGEEISCD